MPSITGRGISGGSVREFVREWAAKTEQDKDAGRPRTRRCGPDRGHSHAKVCSRPGTPRNLRMGPLTAPDDCELVLGVTDALLDLPAVGGRLPAVDCLQFPL